MDNLYIAAAGILFDGFQGRKVSKTMQKVTVAQLKVMEFPKDSTADIGTGAGNHYFIFIFFYHSFHH